MKKLSNIFIVALVIFSVTVLPYQILRDTIEADWAIIWYSGRRMAMPNFVILPLLLFPWIYLIYWSCQQLWLKVTAWRKQELKKKAADRKRESTSFFAFF